MAKKLSVVLFVLTFLVILSSTAFAKDYTLKVSVEGYGSVKVYPYGVQNYPQDSIVSVTPVSIYPGWGFDHWEGPDGKDVLADRLFMTKDREIKAVFTEVYMGYPRLSPGTWVKMRGTGSDSLTYTTTIKDFTYKGERVIAIQDDNESNWLILRPVLEGLQVLARLNSPPFGANPIYRWWRPTEQDVFETVTVPAGTFKAVRRTDSVGTTTWTAPGVGTVKWVSTKGYGRELIAYELKPFPVPQPTQP